MSAHERIQARLYGDVQKALNRELEKPKRHKRPAEVTIGYRQAHFRDAAEIGRAHVDIWKATYRGLMPDEVIRRLNYLRFELRWEDLLARRDEEIVTTLAVEKDHGVAGYLRGGPIERSEDEGLGEFEIYSVNILPRFQRHGIGKNLMYRGLHRLWDLDADDCYVWVLDGNSKARYFFKSLGAEPMRSGIEKMGKNRLPKTAYVWGDLTVALERLADRLGLPFPMEDDTANQLAPLPAYKRPQALKDSNA